MRVVILGVLFLLTVACNSDHADNMKLVDQIEQSIILPKDAYEIQSYARYYARKGDIIYAAYAVHADGWREAVQKECAHQGNVYPCNDPNFGVIEAGQFSWVEKRDYLPIVDGGGCSFVEVEYDVKRKSFTRISCNDSH